MLQLINSVQENILIAPNNSIQNNSQNSNYSNNNYSSQNEPSQCLIKEASINIRKDIVSNNSSIKGSDTSTNNALGKYKPKRKSSNKSENYLIEDVNNNNMIENADEETKNKDENISNGNNNNNYNSNDIGLEPIMEIPPLTKIEKKPNIYEFYINNMEKNSKELFYPNNIISTTKYNCFTFLPKALLYQFARIANIYFVVMAIIQCIPIISPLGSSTAIAPIVFVFAISLIREAIEDFQRGKLDKEQNSDPINTFRNNKWTIVKSGELLLGEIIQVKKDGIFPADLLLIDSNLNDGICYIETGSLDGEKTLKIKYSTTFTKNKFSKTDEKNENKNDNLNKCRNLEIFYNENDRGRILNPKKTKNQNNQNNKRDFSNNNSSSSIKFHQQQKSELQIVENYNKNNKNNNELNKINENNTLESNNNYNKNI